MANKNNLPKPFVDPKTGEIKNANFNSSIWDAYNAQSEEQLEEKEGMKGSPYAGLDYTGMEETEDAVPIVQKLNYRFDPSSFTFKAYDQDGEHVERTFMEKVKDNKTPIIQGSLSIANSVLGRNEMIRNDKDRESQIQDIYGTDPIWDYNEMYGNNTNGGSQFQPIIKAEKGAKVRSMLNTATPIEIEGGEFLVLPDGTTELAKGPKHKDGGINTILPEGSIVYSNKLKPEGSKKTFAQLAKDNDTSSYVKTLKDPFSDTIARNSAERMLQRKQQKLTELFQEQQMMNGNSSGEPMMMKGGYTEYEDGGDVNPPIYTSNPNDPRLQSYNDSLNLYNAYKFQKSIPEKKDSDYEPFFDIYGGSKSKQNFYNAIKAANNKSFKSYDEYEKASADFDKFLLNPQWSTLIKQEPYKSKYEWTNSAATFKNTEDFKKLNIKGDYDKIKYYEKLKFSNPDDVVIGKFSSADIAHKKIKPVDSYWGGKGYNPIYKKPVQPVIYKKEEETTSTAQPITPTPAVTPIETTPAPKVERKVVSVTPEEVKAGTKTTSGKQIGSGTAGGRVYKVNYDNGETEILNEYEYRSKGLKMENGGKIKTIMENGGIVEGQELELTKEEIKFLKKQGFKFDIL
jgi:hypothetical protein